MSDEIEIVARAICPGDPDRQANDIVVTHRPDGWTACSATGPIVPAWRLWEPQARRALVALGRMTGEHSRDKGEQP